MNFGYQSQRLGGGTVAKDGAIDFNTVVVNYDSSISYNNETFTLSAGGDYYVYWYVTIKTGLGTTDPTISLVTSDTEPIEYPSTNSMKTGQISGSAIIRASNSLSFQLINRSNDSIVLADSVNVSAGISIVSLNPSTSGINLYLTDSAGTNIDGGSIIPFDTTSCQFNDLITNTDGVINITTPGKYIVDWSISLQGSLNASSLKFNLVNINDETTTVIGTSESPVITQYTVYGSALINVSSATADDPYVVNLVNASTAPDSTPTTITLSNIGIQASIRIVEL